MNEAAESSMIAVVGLAGRFPGADSPEELWCNLRSGVEAVSFFSPEELLASGVAPDLCTHPRYVPARGTLRDVRSWDAAFFGFSPREAELLDPQQRLFLECAWEALESAGYDPIRFAGRIGVYAGASTSSYWIHNLRAALDPRDPSSSFQVLISNDKDYLPTRVSFLLDLRGPSVGVQTACSTSLVAVHQACQSLLALECDMALAGGVSISVPDKVGYLFQPEGIMSEDGHNRSFDARGTGSVFGDGVGIVLLKRLEDALVDGDCIHAVIRGSAVNNDGSLKVGYTAPSVDAQSEVVAEALAVARVDPATVTYVEAHGSATPLGDPIEVTALTQAFRLRTQRVGYCALGAVKSNLGHLYTASGVASLIKTVLALRHGEIPPSLNFATPNPAIDFAGSPFFVNTELRQWKAAGGAPRRAGVSSLGIGGTNAHMVLEEAPPPEPSGPARPWQLLPLAARTGTALESATANLARFLREHPEAPLPDIAWTLQTGRRAFAHRRVAVCRSRDEAALLLETLDPAGVFTHEHEPGARLVAFLLPGMGEQYPGMGRELYREEPAFRAAIDRCAEWLRPLLGTDLREALYPAGEEGDADEIGLDLRRLLRRDGGAGAAARLLDDTRFAHPAVFAVEYALATLWKEWGIVPQAMLGHSLGEYVAACLAGVFSLEDALTLVAERARRIAELPGGAMLAVPLSERDLRPLLGDALSLAAVNGPTLSVAAGPVGEIEELERELEGFGIASARLRAAHAFHSSLMQPLTEPLMDLLRSVRLQAPSIPYLSNVTGTWITAVQATDPRYWAEHLCRPVRFEPGLRELLRDPAHLLLEVGPGQSLGSFVRQHPDCGDGRVVLPSLRPAALHEADLPFLLRTLGRLWLAGAEVDWAGFHAHERRRRVPLPTYPFERQTYWIEARRSQERTGTPRDLDDLERKSDPADWFYLPVWRETAVRRAAAVDRDGGWLLFVDELGLGSRLAGELRRQGARVITVAAGDRFAATGQETYEVAPGRREDYDQLLAALRSAGRLPGRIVHLWHVTGERPLVPAPEAGFASLLLLVQALVDHGDVRADLAVISDGLQSVTGAEILQPEKALLLGPCIVAPLESPGLTCRSIDLTLSSGTPDALLASLLAELTGDAVEQQVGLRGGRRWVRAFEPVRLNAEEAGRAPLRDGGVYLITGGLGGLGLALAEDLARTCRARLALLGRSGAPEGSPAAQRVQALRARGTEVLVLRADVADEAAVRAAVAETLGHFGALHGVVHAAGLPGAGLIQRKTLEEAAAVLAPKVRGILALERALEGVDLDFLALFSSITAWSGGGPGQVDYCAASAFLDAFARSRSAAGRPVVSIDWGEWRWDAWGGSLAALEPELAELFRENRRKYGIAFDEGTEAFRRILGRGLSQVLVVTQDLDGFLALSRTFTAARVLERIEKGRAAKPIHPRPALGTSYIAPRNAEERRMAALWEEMLGIDRVGIHDNFFDLGGNSLLGISLISRLQKEFQAEVARHVLYEAPTVALLVERISGGGGTALDEWRDRGEKRRSRPRQPRWDTPVREELS